MLVITSPEKTIMVTGRINSKNQEIKDENIIGYSIDSEKRHIASESGSQDLLKPRFFEEPNGYNELFTEEDISNLDKWSITIYYKKDNKELSEEIKLSTEQILSTDKYEREEIEPIARPDDQSEEIDYEELINKLKESGFEQKGTNTWELVTDKYSLLFELYGEDSIYYSEGYYRFEVQGYINSSGKHANIIFTPDLLKNNFIYDGKKLICEEESECSTEMKEKVNKVLDIIEKYVLA